MIPVTRSYLPNKEKFKAYIDQIYDSGWLTNRGNLLLELEGVCLLIWVLSILFL